jgi:hypothetical protein
VSTFIRVANQLREARDTTQRQLQAEEKKKQKNKTDNSRAHSLRRSLETLHRRVNTLESLMKQVFNGSVRELTLFRAVFPGFYGGAFLTV